MPRHRIGQSHDWDMPVGYHLCHLATVGVVPGDILPIISSVEISGMQNDLHIQSKCPTLASRPVISFEDFESYIVFSKDLSQCKARYPCSNDENMRSIVSASHGCVINQVDNGMCVAVPMFNQTVFSLATIAKFMN